MSKLHRSVAVLASAMAFSGGALISTAHAVDQVGPPSVAPTAGGAKSTPVATTPPAAKAPAAKPPAPGAPQVPEESATIRDDPTIAPDPKQSADNSVSYPNDT
jgi:hypothetical protein